MVYIFDKLVNDKSPDIPIVIAFVLEDLLFLTLFGEDVLLLGGTAKVRILKELETLKSGSSPRLSDFKEELARCVQVTSSHKRKHIFHDLVLVFLVQIMK